LLPHDRQRGSIGEDGSLQRGYSFGIARLSRNDFGERPELNGRASGLV
jgi:hypothetical protein